MHKINQVRIGDSITAVRQNKIIDNLRANRLNASAPLMVTETPGGTFISLDGEFQEAWVGHIELRGNADFTDSRYRVKRQYISDSTSYTNKVLSDIMIFGDSLRPSDYVVATNVREQADQTHLLVSDTMVLVHEVNDLDGNTRYVFATQPPTAGVMLWGVASDHWENADGNGSFVKVNPCTDKAGADRDTDVVRTVFLTRTYDTSNVPATDPNVRSDQVIAYSLTGDGTYAASYPDAPIGTVRIWTDPDVIPPGWYLCDGNNGTKDLRGRFIVGYYSDAGLPILSNLGADGDYSRVSDTVKGAGGHGWHGYGTYSDTVHVTPVSNNHPVHSDHIHLVALIAETGRTGRISAVDSLLYDDITSTPWNVHDGASWSCITLKHKGIYNNGLDTDNRPPYYTVVFIERRD